MSDTRRVRAPLQGVVVQVAVKKGDAVREGQTLVIVEAMKMEHVVAAECAGIVTDVRVSEQKVVGKNDTMLVLEVRQDSKNAAQEEMAPQDGAARVDLAEVRERHAFGLDENRPDAVAKRRKTGQRTARENIADLVDEGTLVEYGALVVAAQRKRRSMEDLIKRTPGDGMVAGIANVNSGSFGEEHTQCVVMTYDYTVLAGTQGTMNHLKKDRLFEIAEKQQLPVVLFSEGGGGRPGDTDHAIVTGLDCRAFQYFAALGGKVPLVGINAGRCFAGNAALLGCCDVVIATKHSNIGMGGPAMIEGGGLGVFKPDDIGPSDVQYQNGVIDVLVDTEAEAVAAAKTYLGYFQGNTTNWTADDQTALRTAIPENRVRAYDVRHVVRTLADTSSVLELKGGFGVGVITALARVEGAPVGIVANNPMHLGGAIDGDAARKAASFLNLCDTFGVPVVFLCDTPGFMVGPDTEATGMVRSAATLFRAGAALGVPFCTVVLRKGYGLGAQSMAGGGFKAPLFTVAWPTGEFGAMGLEGAVKLGFRKELAAIEDPEKREQLMQQMVDQLYEHGKAINMATHFEIDAVIDPVETRKWILTAVRSRA